MKTDDHYDYFVQNYDYFVQNYDHIVNNETTKLLVQEIEELQAKYNKYRN